MGCTICKQLKTEHYEEKAGDCLFCMSVNAVIAAAICAAAWWVGLPWWAAGAAFGAMLVRIKRVGYLFPDTPRWLPYVDFIFRPLGYAPSDEEVLVEFAEDVTELCNEEYSGEDDQSECVNDVAEIVMAYGEGHLDEQQYLVNLADRLDLSVEEVRSHAESQG